MPRQPVVRTIFILILLLSFSSFSRQNEDGFSVSLGLKSGIVRGELVSRGVDVLENQLRKGFEILSSDPVLSFAGGAGATLYFDENLAIQPEILYQRTGIAYEGLLGRREYLFGLRVDYVSVPVLLKLMFPLNSDANRLELNVVTQVSYRARAEVYGLNDIPSDQIRLGALEPVRTQENLTDETRALSFSFGLGTAFQFRLGPGFLGLDFRYLWGMTDVLDTDTLNANAEKVKNRMLVLLLGYSIRLQSY